MRHQIYVQRFAGGLVKDLFKYIDDLEAELTSVLSQGAVLSATKNKNIIVQVNEAIDAAIGSMSNELQGSLEDFTQYEVSHTNGMLQGAIAGKASVAQLTGNQVRALSSKSLNNMVLNGKRAKLDTEFNKIGTTMKVDFNNVVRDSIRKGKGIRLISRELINKEKLSLGEQAIKYTRSDIAKTRRQIDTLTRTATNHVANTARLESYQKNSDILKGVKYTATLDSRTSIICGSRDGRVYSFDDASRPTLPAHYNCRSAWTPVLKEEFDIDVTETRASNSELTVDGEKTGKKGTVSGGTDYEKFLRRQNVAFQEEVLGKERANLFRKGKLPLSSFVDDSGKTYSIKKLAELDKVAA